MIMYMILAGKHPLHEKGDCLETYKAKTRNPQWSFTENFHSLAKSLFLNMVKTEPIERYTAKEALSHPWITRHIDPIPMVLAETIALEQAKKKIKNVWYY